jgi:hypothetical protein
VAIRSERRVLSSRCLLALDFTAAGPYSGCRGSYLAQTGTLKVSVFAWKLLCYRLPTKANLVSRDIIDSAAHSCVSECGGVESAQHLFIDCSTFGSFGRWYGPGLTFRRWIPIPYQIIFCS